MKVNWMNGKIIQDMFVFNLYNSRVKLEWGMGNGKREIDDRNLKNEERGKMNAQKRHRTKGNEQSKEKSDK